MTTTSEIRTYHMTGDLVRASATVQGLQRGHEYRVVTVDVTACLGNAYVVYHVQAAAEPTAAPLAVGNGHLILKRTVLAEGGTHA